MKGWKLRIFALCLVAALMLSGCINPVDPEVLTRNAGAVVYADMEYERPDMLKLEQVLEESCETARTETDINTVLEAIYAFYDEYDRFYTNYALAHIRYNGDLTDTYWEGEHTFCAGQTGTVDAGLDELYRALAESPIRDELETDSYFGAGFFDAYEGESVWDEQFLAYLDQETELINRYYDLSTQALEVEAYSEEYYEVYGTQMAQVLVELIALRQELAAYLGYDSYPQFAYDFYYYRDYTAEQVADYLEQIRSELVPLYRELGQSDVWALGNVSCSAEEAFQFVKAASENMGGLIDGAFQLMEQSGLYDIKYSVNKYNASFETYLFSYYEPFLFMNPTMTARDKLTFAHEFGHFAHDYVCWGTYASTDVSEVMSQGMEYLALVYGGDTEDLARLKMADCLCVYVEQAAYASFEHQVYDLRGAELTAENVQALYEDIGTAYGFDTWEWDPRDYVGVTHFFTDPMYIISYVVSNDAAFQLYQTELEEPGYGLVMYKNCLYSGESYFLTFVENMGLESPFAEGRLAEIRQILEEILK